MIKKRKFLLAVLLILIITWSLGGWHAAMVSAAADSSGSAGEEVLGNLGATGRASGLTDKSLTDVVAIVIKGALGLVAVIFFIMIVIAGFSWMTAGGNEETVKNAKKNMSNAVIGLIVILFSYAITYFVFDVLLNKAG